MALLVSGRGLRGFFLPERGVVLPRPYALIACVGIAAGIALAVSAVGQRLEWQLYDQYITRESTGREPAPGVVVVAIDELSFSQIGIAWPWPRSLHAALIEQLVEGGARSIAFDIVFDVPGAQPDDDEAFAVAIARAGNVVLAADRAAIEERGYTVTQWSDPIAPFATAARAVGAVRIPFDPDGVLRRSWLMMDGRPSLALAVARQEPGFAAPGPFDLSEPHLFRFNGLPRRGVTTVSYYQALDAARALPAGVFAGKHVLVGRSLAAPTDSGADQFKTPVALQMAGVEVHATVVDALLRHRFIRDLTASAAGYAAVSVITAALAAVALFFVGPAAGAALTGTAIAALVIGGYGAIVNGVRLPVTGPALTLAMAYASTSAYRFALATRERRMIKRAFQHYVAPAIVERMLNDPSQLKLGGEQYTVSVLFSDLEGFTTLGERLTPAELSVHLGRYFQEMLDVLLPHQGTLDKLIGDSIMMYFGCPLPDAEHALHACRGALAMQRRMAALNERWGSQGLPQLRTRVGVNTGVVVAGNMGTTTIFNYTILGDCVNLASRLEGVNKEYGTAIIVGEDTWQLVEGAFEGRELDWIRVKGKSLPVTIYELVSERGAIDERQRDVLRFFAEGLRLYRDRRWGEAAAAFQQALVLESGDGPSRRFAERCAAYGSRPPAEWDGVHVMRG